MELGCEVVPSNDFRGIEIYFFQGLAIINFYSIRSCYEALKPVDMVTRIEACRSLRKMDWVVEVVHGRRLREE
jgi:hypothetical protein